VGDDAARQLMVGPVRRIKKLRNGRWDLRLPDEERHVLRALVPQLRELLGGDDPALRRLFPTAYLGDGEADAEAFYRQVTYDELVALRLARLEGFEAMLDAHEVTSAQLESAMGAVNDLRLVLGTRLDVSEHDADRDLDAEDPEAPLYAVYTYLGWVLEMIVEALFATVPEAGFEVDEAGGEAQ
jgi:Domain of unknown function (DUF2017)